MAPREAVKTTPKMQRTISKTRSKASPISTIKKTMATRKLVDKTPLKVNNLAAPKTVVPSTPKPKEKPVTVPGSVTKSGKKVVRKRPNKAHSGVPVPDKMLKMMGKQLQAVGAL